MNANGWEPIDHLTEFREREECLREVKELLGEKVHHDTGRMWAHHLPRIVDQLDFFRGLLEEEIECFGEWRWHGFQPDEVLDFIDEDLDELSRWIGRMTGLQSFRDGLP